MQLFQVDTIGERGFWGGCGGSNLKFWVYYEEHDKHTWAFSLATSKLVLPSLFRASVLALLRMHCARN